MTKCLKISLIRIFFTRNLCVSRKQAITKSMNIKEFKKASEKSLMKNGKIVD